MCWGETSFNRIVSACGQVLRKGAMSMRWPWTGVTTSGSQERKSRPLENSFPIVASEDVGPGESDT